jgi:hypothetical protein
MAEWLSRWISSAIDASSMRTDALPQFDVNVKAKVFSRCKFHWKDLRGMVEDQSRIFVENIY